MKHTSVQAQEISYELNTLGWKSFQDLCVTIISDVLGQTVQSFSSVKDGGRDGAFHGTWKNKTDADMAGTFTVQCKFTSSRDKSITLSSLKDELRKARRLARNGLSDNYILMTNYGVSGSTDEKIRKAFLSIPKINNFVLLGTEWITRKIKESSKLRMLVPRVYGLGDLSQILDERAYNQAQEILESMREDLKKVVITEAYNKSARAIIKHGFVLLLGEPASGKTTIAAALSLGALDNWSCSTIVIRNANDFLSRWNPKEKQYFWVDDAFGTTQYQRSTADEWNRVFPHMKAAIQQGTRILFTSRDYIYRAATLDLKTHVFPLLKDSQVIINVQELSLNERKQILYNHIKFGDQDQSFRQRIKHFLNDVAAGRHFLPETARRLGNRVFTKTLVLTRDSVIDFSEKPLLFLVEIVKSVSPDSRAALTLLYMHAGSLKSPLQLDDEDKNAMSLLGTNIAAVREALAHMDGSLTKYVRIEGIPHWIFRHPTVADAVAVIVAEDPELLDIYITGTSTERLMNEVTCGNVNYEGVKVILPPSRYDTFIERLDNVTNENSLFHFLAFRCDKDFLKIYAELHPTFYEIVSNTGSYIHAHPRASVIATLHRYNILPEEWRLKFVETVEKLAISTPDADFLEIKKFREILRESEITRILNHVNEDLFSDIQPIVEIVEGMESNWEYDLLNSPDTHYERLKTTLDTFYQEFLYHDMAVEMIEEGLSEIEKAIERLNEYYSEHEEDYNKYSDSISDSLDRDEERSIFDDLDE